MARLSLVKWCSLAAIFFLCVQARAERRERYDVVVYTATAGGVMAAVSAAAEGVSVALFEPRKHVGGMVSGGLGNTDIVNQSGLIGGRTVEYFRRVGKHYGEPIAYKFEPHVAEQVFRELLAEAGVEVFFDHRLADIVMEGQRITEARFTNGTSVKASVFIDTGYEGDLMAAAKVSYAVGRESRALYGESLAGRQEFMVRHHQFKTHVSPYDESGRLLPYVQPIENIGLPGDGDGKMQSYQFRLCLTDNPENRVPIERPKNYDPSRYGLLKNYLLTLKEPSQLSDFLSLGKMPNRKTDTNSRPPVSLNLLGAGWKYPDSDPPTRDRIWEEHRQWAHGFLYFLGHDESVPENVRQEMAEWGLPKDEFADTNHWPHQLYIREGRRMLGEYILTQHDLMEGRAQQDSIGMAGYNIDIREVQWVAAPVYTFPTKIDAVVEEGYVSQPVKPYAIPYRILLPRASQCVNLLVPVCVSASQVAFASIRMEPQYMIMGHSAGVAAAQAIKSRRDLHRIDLVQLQQTLRSQGQILEAGMVAAQH